MRTLRRAILFATALYVLLVADGVSDDVQTSDVGIVLGSKVNPDGVPSARLAARLDKALRLYRQGLLRSVIVSGGVGKEGFDEAAVMQRWLVARGVPAGAILVDRHGDNTWATAVNSAALMRPRLDPRHGGDPVLPRRPHQAGPAQTRSPHRFRLPRRLRRGAGWVLLGAGSAGGRGILAEAGCAVDSGRVCVRRRRPMQEQEKYQVRAVYDDKTIRVYQAYGDQIADAALKHGTFKVGRMT
jgi:hypothetical protein